MRNEFEDAMDKTPREYWIKKYGIERLSALLNSNTNLCDRCQSAIKQNIINKTHSHKIEGEHEKRFKSILLNIMNELPSDTDGKPVEYPKI